MSEKENRFDGLMGAVRGKTNAQTSERSDVQKSRTKTQEPSSTVKDALTSDNSNTSTSKPRNDLDSKSESQAEAHSAHSNIQTSKIAKSANPDYTRTTIYLPKKMHKKLKAIAIEEEKEMSSIVEELISAWLISQS